MVDIELRFIFHIDLKRTVDSVGKQSFQSIYF